MKTASKPEVRTSPRKAARQDRSKATVDALLAGTARVLVNEGFDSASTNKIAKEAGVSIGSLYQYFPNKQALVAALIEQETSQDIEAIESCFRQMADAPREQVLREIIRLVTYSYGRKAALRCVLVDQIPKVGKLRRIQEIENEVGGMIYDRLLKQSGKSPENEMLEKFILTKSVMGVLRSAAQERAEYLNQNELVERLTLICLRAFPTFPL